MTGLALDHVAFGVLDAAAASRSFESLGFAATGVGACRWNDGAGAMAAASASVVLPREYLDLVEIDHPAWARHVESSRVYGRGLAPSGIVLRGFSREELRARGGSYEIVRTLPGASPSEIHYEFLLERGTGLPLGLIADAAPQAMRTEAWIAHPNTSTRIRGLHVWVPSVSDVADWIDVEALGIRLWQTGDDPYLAEVLDLLEPAGRPSLLSIELEVSDLAAARTRLRAAGIEFRERPDRLQVAPAAGFGTGIQLVAED